jgi:hypothetical protein
MPALVMPDNMCVNLVNFDVPCLHLLTRSTASQALKSIKDLMRKSIEAASHNNTLISVHSYCYN